MITPSLIQEKNNDTSLYLGLFEKSPKYSEISLFFSWINEGVIIN